MNTRNDSDTTETAKSNAGTSHALLRSASLRMARWYDRCGLRAEAQHIRDTIGA